MRHHNESKLQVFLCHASEDKIEVRNLYHRLFEVGFSPWLDQYDILPGQDWEAEIRRTVYRADIILVCLSSRAVAKRGFIQKEIVFALDTAKEQPEDSIYIIPVLLEDCSVPERLSQWQWVNISLLDGYTKLISALNFQASQLKKEVGMLPESKMLKSGSVPTRYAKSNGIHIAYQVWGEGDNDIILIHGGFVPIQSMTSHAYFEYYIRQLVNIGRVIIFDFRGIGNSDPLPPNCIPSVDNWAQDAISVLNAIGSKNVTAIGNDTGGAAAIALATNFPNQVKKLVLFHAYARLIYSPDYPFGHRLPEQDTQKGWIDEVWDGEDKDMLALLAPSIIDNNDFIRWWQQATFHGASPGVAGTFDEMTRVLDVRQNLHLVNVPTLILHRKNTKYIVPEHSKYLAKHIKNTKYVELLGADHWIYVGNVDVIISEIKQFLKNN